MPDREKVIKWLDVCKTADKAVGLKEDYPCRECPYKDLQGCMRELITDALALLKPRILTLDEALGSDDPVYFESNGRMECWVDAYISDDLQCAVFYRFRATEFMLPLSRYKKDWRCWSAPPSYEQSKAVKWDA